MANYYYKDESSQELIEKVVAVNRSAKVVKGGRRFSFSALVVVGDGEGRVGIGFGKALEVSDAIAKALNDGRKSLVSIPRYRSTIPYEILGKFKGSKVLLKPATSGTGIIAGGAVRAVIESAGIRDILSKSLGSSNPTNMAKATINALASLMTKELAFKRRGKPLPVRKEAEAAAAPVAQ